MTGPNSACSPLSPMEDWLAIACHLRAQNRQLLVTAMRLERSLVEAQRQLQQQLQRSPSPHCDGELEACREQARQQQLRIETLVEQLAASQEHAAQLEEHCLLLQQECQNHAETLAATQQQVEELQSRLSLKSGEKGFLALQQGETFPTLANWSEPTLPSLNEV